MWEGTFIFRDNQHILLISLKFYTPNNPSAAHTARPVGMCFALTGPLMGRLLILRGARTDSKGPFWERDAVDKDTLPFLSSFKYHGEGHRMESTFISITRCYGGELIAHLLMTGQANA